MPEDAWSPRRRDERIAAALAGLRAEREEAERRAVEGEAAKAEAYWQRRRGGQRAGSPPAAAALALARENLEQARADRAARLAVLEERYAAGQPRRGRAAGIEDYCRVRQAAAALEKATARAARAAERDKDRAGPGPVRNVTDPDSRLMPVRGGGFLQGYNAQNVTSADGLIIATELTADTNDAGWFEPMLRAAEDAAARITAHRTAGQHQDGGIGLVLADAGYCSEANLTAQGPDRLIATGKHRDLERAAAGGAPRRRGRERAGPATTAMAARLKTAAGITAYRQRGHIAETPHGHLKHNMGFRQLRLRGKRKASAEWAFACAVHNLSKALSGGSLTSRALNALAA